MGKKCGQETPLLKFTGSSHFRVIRAPNLCIVAMQLFSKVLLKAFPPAAGIVYISGNGWEKKLGKN
jgi:hypothetical protein